MPNHDTETLHNLGVRGVFMHDGWSTFSRRYGGEDSTIESVHRCPWQSYVVCKPSMPSGAPIVDDQAGLEPQPCVAAQVAQVLVEDNLGQCPVRRYS